MTEPQHTVEERDRHLSLALRVTVPLEDLPENEEMYVENVVQDYIGGKYDVWWSSATFVIQEGRRTVDGPSKRFKVAVLA